MFVSIRMFIPRKLNSKENLSENLALSLLKNLIPLPSEKTPIEREGNLTIAPNPDDHSYESVRR